jgi:hypothetical protein
MRKHEVGVLDLSDARPFTPAEERLAQVIVVTARGRGTMFRGRLAECEVAIALGAEHPDVGTSHWDLRLPAPDGRTIEVKSCGANKKFSIGTKPRDVDLWIFVHVSNDEVGTRFTVASNDQVNEEREKFAPVRKSPVRLPSATVSKWGMHTVDELAAAVSDTPTAS